LVEGRFAVAGRESAVEAEDLGVRRTLVVAVDHRSSAYLPLQYFESLIANKEETVVDGGE
jgi:hypothetical protein